MGFNNKRNFLALAGFLLTTTVAEAGSGSNGYFDRARVIAVDPITKNVRVNQPREECWYETVSSSRDYNQGYEQKHTSRTPEIFGAIIGSAVGRQFGSGRGQDVATVAGAILGGSIGRDVKNNGRRHNRKHRNETRQERRCETINDVVYEERIKAYRVTYKYNGHNYTTRMRNHPGKNIRVKVNVKPVS